MRRMIQAQTNKTINASWANGLPITDANGKRDRKVAPFVGFFLDCNLDSALDDAATAAGWDRGFLAHSNEHVEHWLAPLPIDMFILIEGLMAIPQKETPDRMVLPMAWAGQDIADLGLRVTWDDKARKSAMGVHVVFADLYHHGYCTPIPLTVTKMRCKELARILYAHYAVLDAAEAAAKAAGKPRDFEYYDVSVRIVDGDPERYQSSTNNESSESIPMVFVKPDGLDELRAQTAAMAAKNARSKDQPKIAQIKETYWGEIVAWASYRWEAR